MTDLIRLPAGAAVEEVLDVVRQDGAVILNGVMSAAVLAALRAEIEPYVAATRQGADDFSGVQTTRTGALVARSPACRGLVTHPLVLAAAREFLAPYCHRIQLHLTQVIRLMPGQGAQALHRDRWAWGRYLHGVEPQLNTIWAVTDFTAENGATRVVPGSIAWPDDRKAEDDEICQAIMPAGSVLIYTGSVFHGGGENRSNGDRIGLNLTYSLAWLRQEENQYLSCPPEIAGSLPEELQDLLGYSQGSYALGYYTPPLPPGEGPECVGPEYALGRGGATALGGQELLDAVRKAAQQS